MPDAGASTAGAEQSIETEGWGEDGRYAIARGHVDKAAFLEAVARDAQIPVDDLDADGVEHAYWRPATPEDYADEGLTAEDVDGWMFWGGVAASDGEPITVLDLEA